MTTDLQSRLERLREAMNPLHVVQAQRHAALAGRPRPGGGALARFKTQRRQAGAVTTPRRARASASPRGAGGSTGAGSTVGVAAASSAGSVGTAPTAEQVASILVQMHTEDLEALVRMLEERRAGDYVPSTAA